MDHLHRALTASGFVHSLLPQPPPPPRKSSACAQHLRFASEVGVVLDGRTFKKKFFLSGYVNVSFMRAGLQPWKLLYWFWGLANGILVAMCCSTPVAHLLWRVNVDNQSMKATKISSSICL